MQTKRIMNESDKLLPFLKKAQKLQIKHFGELPIWINSFKGMFFTVVVFFKDDNQSISFFNDNNLEELNINYSKLLILIKEANEEM